jgi:hypothetical protein
VDRDEGSAAVVQECHSVAAPARPRAADADLPRVAALRALEWILKNIEHFRFRIPEDVAERGQRLAELAIATFQYATLTGDRTGERVQALLEPLVEARARDELRDRVLRDPSSLVLVCTLHGALRQLGLEDSELDVLLRRAVDARLPLQVERPPHRLMEVRLALAWCGLPLFLRETDSACNTEVTSGPSDVSFMDESALYALTHRIMFLTEYGLRPPQQLVLDEAVTLADILQQALIVSAQARHWDLLAELLLCWDAARLSHHWSVEMAWNTLLSVQCSDGSIPAIGAENEEIALAAAQHKSGMDGSDFHQRYHTSLVVVMAGTLHAAQATTRSLGGKSAAKDLHRRRHAIASKLDVTAIAMRSREYLEDLVRRLEGSNAVNVSQLSQLYIAIRVCDWVLDRSWSDLDARAGSLLTAASEAGIQLDHDDVMSQLATVGLLAARGIHLPQLDATFHAVGGLLACKPGPEFAEARQLLFAFGVLSAPAQPEYDEALYPLRQLRLDSPPALLRAAALSVNWLSACGTTEVALRRDDRWIAELFAGCALSFARAYDLPLASRLLRAASYVGAASTPTARSCARYLSLQQRPSGSFGFLGAARSGSFNEQLAKELSVDVPLTLACLLALAESGSPRWRFHDALLGERRQASANQV